jgi:hypothetical protein
MTRLLLAVLFAALATACTNGTATDPGSESGDVDAEAFKTELDAFARETLPKLEAEVGGQWQGFSGHFLEKGGNTGRWEYTADGGTSKPPGTGEEVLDRVEAVLVAHGMTITRPDVIADITGRKGNIAVQVTRALDADVESVSALNVTFSSFDRLTSSDDFAEDAGSTELLK